LSYSAPFSQFLRNRNRAVRLVPRKKPYDSIAEVVISRHD
jgi:hypothetical protein